MSNQNKSKPETLTKPGAPSLENPSEKALDQEGTLQQASSDRRKAAQSKREIMEQLSRERFPWDE